MNTSQLKDHLEHYLKLGLTVVRLKYRDKRPAGKWEDNIFTRTNLEQLLRDGPWNVGILLGKRSKNLIVFDYESREALAEHYEILEEFGLTDLLDTWVVETGKGLHVYYFIDWRDPHAAELIKPVTLNAFFSKLEIRGDGNYVVAPTSIHPSGKAYQFVQGPYLPIRTIGAKEYALLLYTYAKTGDISAVKFEELHKFLTKLYASYHEIDVLPPAPQEPKALEVSKYTSEMPVSEDVNAPVIANLVRQFLPYVGRQDFTLTLASALARLGVHPLKSAEILAALLDDKRFTERRSERDKNEVQEAKQRVQAWIYAYNNVWRVLRGKTLENAFPGIREEFIKTLQEKSKRFGQHITGDWWYAPSSSGDRLRGIPALTDTIASAIEAREKQEGRVISPEAARELAWRVVQDIIKAAKPARRRVERLTRLTRVYVIGTPKVQEVYLVPDKKPSQTYLALEQRLRDKNPALAKELEGKTLAFKVVSIPVIFQGRDGVIYKGLKKVYYYRVVGQKIEDAEDADEAEVDDEEATEWESFAVEFNKGVPLTAKPIEVLKAVFYEGVTFLKLYVEGKIIEGNIETVIDTLVKGGITTSYEKEILRKYFTWISQSFRGTAYLAPGIYEDRGRFVPILPTTTDALLPHSPLTSAFVDRLKLWAQKVTKEDYENFLEGIIEYKKYLPPSVYYAAMGYLGIAGFLSSILDITGSVKPALLFLGPKGTGKSHLAKFIAVNAYGSEVWGPSAYRSDFRFDELFSSRTFPLHFDDIHEYGSQKLQDLKATLTENTQTFRGRGIGSVKLYQLAAVPIFTANAMVPEFENDAALLDRLIILEITETLPPAKKREYRENLDDLVGISRGTVYTHHFIKELVDVVNEVGGKSSIKGAFRRWFKYAADHNITDGRDPEKFAILMTGAELLAALLAKHGYDFNLDEAAKAVLEIFAKKDTLIPQELHDLISLAEEHEIGIKHDEGLLITNKLLTTIRTRNKGGNFKLPRRLRDIAILLEGLGYPRSKTLPEKGHYVPSLKSKVYGVLIPWEVIELVVGKEAPESEEEDEISKELLNEIAYHLSMEDLTFDELRQMTNIPEAKLKKGLEYLIKGGAVYPRSGKYHLIRSKAKEMGLDVVDTISVSKRRDPHH